MKKILSLFIATLILFGGCIRSLPPDNIGLDSQRDTGSTDSEQTDAAPSDLTTAPATSTDPGQTAATSTDHEQTASAPSGPTSPEYDPSLYTPSVNEGQYELLVEVKPSVIPMHKVTSSLLISITNLSEEEYRSKFLYSIEQFDGNDWVTIPHSDGMLGQYPLISLKKGESLEKEKQVNVVFTPGRYRVKVDDWYGEFEIVPSDPNMISVEFDPNPITLEEFVDSGILVTIRNMSDETYEGGQAVDSLEHFDGGEWITVPWAEGRAVFLFLHFVKPGETFNVDRLKADMFDYDFSPGKYRVRYDQWFGEFDII